MREACSVWRAASLVESGLVARGEGQGARVGRIWGGGARTDSFEAETRFNLCINIGFSVGRKSAVVLAALVYLGPSIGGTE